MMKPENFPSSNFTIRFISMFFLYLLLFTVFPGTHCSNLQPQQHPDCQSYFSCGKLNGISFPFWTNNQSHCGQQGFELQCNPNDYPVINVNDQNFHVLEIHRNSYRLKLVPSEIRHGECPYVDTSLDPALFDYFTRKTRNLSIFSDCIIGNFPLGSPYRFPCITKDGLHQEFFPLEFLDGSQILGCRIHIVVPVLITAYNQLASGNLSLNEALNKGFIANYYSDDDPHRDYCKDCQDSGGKCMSEKGSKQVYCICNGESHQGPCLSLINDRDYSQWNVLYIIGIGFGTGMIIACLIIYGYKSVILVSQMINRKMQKEPTIEEYLKKYGSLAPKRYHCSDIKKMTNSFREKLGEGGFCSVYKGKLEDGRLVAVKVLKTEKIKANGEEFINEVISISRTSHVNIVSLLGYCYTARRKALVFEFMPNGSLEKFIHNKNTSTAGHLPWEKLHEIAIGIARGLEYLHRGCNTRILHFDIKPHNILLDEDFCPKISDFGLAKLCPKGSAITSVNARGTIGYIAPEVFSRNFGRVSHKSDVYSFGMMVLEMVGGRKNVDVGADHSSEIYYPHWVYDRLQQGNNLGLHGVSTSQDNEIAKKMIIIGLWCIQTYPVHRPSMNEVLFMLEGSLDALKIPPKPIIFSPTRSPMQFFTAPVL